MVHERNRITHSVLTGCSGEFSLLHPRKAEPFVARHDPLPSADELRLLTGRIEDLTGRVMAACEPAWHYAGYRAD